MNRGFGALALAVAACILGCDTKKLCEGSTKLVYDPASGWPDAFPDDYFSRDDPESPTGLRVTMMPGFGIVVPNSLAPMSNVFEQLSGLDGFGTTADLLLRFSGPLDDTTLDGGGTPESSVLLVELGPQGPALVPATIRQLHEGGDGGALLHITPLRPLTPKTSYGLALTTRVLASDGDCVAPSATMAQLLIGEAKTEPVKRMAPRVQEIVEALESLDAIDGLTELSAAVAFTTQDTLSTSMKVATALRGTPVPYRARGDCAEEETFFICEGELDAADFRVDGRQIDSRAPAPQRTNTLPVTTWIPKSGKRPFPTLIYGHGLSLDHYEAAELAVRLAAQGFATIAIDAVKHGEHPDQSEHSGDFAVLDFLGISMSMDPVVDAIRMRDNFRQSTYDKLQVMELLRAGLDVNGDGQAELSTAWLGYEGVSLGAAMLPELVALAPEIRAAVAVTPGAQLTTVIENGEYANIFYDLLLYRTSTAEQALFYEAVQTVIDPADPAAWGPFVERSRLPEFNAGPTQTLIQVGLFDEVFPRTCGEAYGRSLGLPIVGDLLAEIAGLVSEPQLPTSSNVAAGVSGGLFELDTLGPHSSWPATHLAVPASKVARTQSDHFLITARASGTAEIIDPYRELGYKD